MIAHSTRSRARRIAGISLATVLVGLGLGLTASGSIAAPSEITPKSVRPLLQVRTTPQPLPAPQAIVIAERTGEAATRTGDDTDADQADAATSPIPPEAPQAPVVALPPVSPVAPLPPLPPMNVKLSAEQEAKVREAARQAGEQARAAGDAARQAGEAARQAVANIDFAAISREAMIQARSELVRSCKHARPAPAGETDAQAVSRLALGCVDMAAINRQVQDSLRDAMEQVRHDQHISEADRARALAEIDKTRAEMAHKFSQ